jgi:hypothetical protein
MMYELEFDMIWKETVVVFKGHDMDIYVEGPRKNHENGDEPAETRNTYLQSASTGC